MPRHRANNLRALSLALALALPLLCPERLPGEPRPAATSAFNSYVSAVEARLEKQHRSPDLFLAADGQTEDRLRHGEVVIEQLTPSTAGSGALLHHWRGTAFVPGARAADLERLLQDVDAYPRRFSPEVLRARVLRRDGDRLQTSMRVRQKHVITVVMDTDYDVTFGRLDLQHGYSTSRSTRISEIDSPGTRGEHPLAPDDEHGFLWRLNTYWSYGESAGGLFLQVETVSLSRAIPPGLGWALRPYVESVPRESLEFTLRSACKTLQDQHATERTR